LKAVLEASKNLVTDPSSIFIGVDKTEKKCNISFKHMVEHIDRLNINMHIMDKN